MAVIVVLVVGGIVLLRVSSSGDDGSNQTATIDDESSAKDSDVSEQQTADQKTEDPSSSDAGDTSGSEGVATNTSSVNFVKGGRSIDANNVYIISAADQNLDGVCTYTFTLGNTEVEKAVNSTGKSCDITVPITSFNKSGDWSYTLSYVSNDKLVVGTTVGGSIHLVPAEFSFNKGGGNFDGDNVMVSETTTDPQTGTCEYLFTLGNSRVEKSSTISNSRTCSITIPGSAFPKSGNWFYSLTFNSTEEFSVGSGGGYEITVN